MVSFFDSLLMLHRAGGATSRWETAKFALRGCLQWEAHRCWSRFLLDNEALYEWAMAHPHLLWKLQRPYLQRSLPLASKLAWLQDHYEWALRHTPEPLQRTLRLRGQAELARLEAEGSTYRLLLAVDAQFAKEGEWTLALWRGDARLAVLAFAVHRDNAVPGVEAGDRVWVAHVGCLQGTIGADGADVVRTATRELQGLRPKQAVLQALYALVRSPAGAGDGAVQRLQAVANAGHVYQGHRRRRERVVADYDAFWQEFGAQQVGEMFLLPGTLPRKALEDVPTRKRAQYRRRWAIEDQVAAQVAEAMTTGLIADAVSVAATPGALLAA